jgi:ribosomal protein S18 acetylase RimI-like enzyme
MCWRVERATLADLGQVSGVLEQAADWLRQRGVKQWPSRFPAHLLAPPIENGETWLVRSAAGEVVATITVDHADRAWQDLPGDAAYVHRMASRRPGEGVGEWLLDWVAQVACEEGRDAVRLDCVTANDRLCGYYERLGFRARGTVTVGGSPGERRTDKTSTKTVVRRYERLLEAAGEPPRTRKRS